MSDTVRKICLTGMGTALFVVLTLCVQVPVFENYYLCLGYIAMAVFCYSVGTGSGTFVGVAGVILYCLLTGGLRGMPGWAAGNVVIGIALGVLFQGIGKVQGTGSQGTGKALGTGSQGTGKEQDSGFQGIRDRKMTVPAAIMSVAVIILAAAAGILGVKSLVEHILYAQPFLVRAVKNSYAFAADAFVLIVSLPVCRLLHGKVRGIVGGR